MIDKDTIFCGGALPVPDNLVGHDSADYRHCAIKIDSLLEGVKLSGSVAVISAEQCACDHISPDVIRALIGLCELHGYELRYDDDDREFTVGILAPGREEATEVLD